MTSQEFTAELLDRQAEFDGLEPELEMTVRDPELRVQVVDQRTAFDRDPDGFSTAVEGNQKALQDRVVEAQQRLDTVTIDEDLRLRISAVCGELDVDGLRGDIVTNRAARALAAFKGKMEVDEKDVASVACSCLRHRLRKDPLEQVDSGNRVVKVFCKIFEHSDSMEFELALTV